MMYEEERIGKKEKFSIGDDDDAGIERGETRESSSIRGPI